MLAHNVLIKSLFSFIFLLFNLTVSQSVIENDNVIVGLPFCGGNNIPIGSKRLILVSTLDGKLSALNMEDGGLETWSISTGPGAMLSSSIHRLELTNNGQWVRMIPSLSGGLYKFNGDFIEAIPITADNLLRSSFKYSDDLVISGGRESRAYGVELETGRVLYECSLGGCDNYTELDSPGDVVLVQRQTQTVRAVEPRTGIERWNFSVGQHEVKVSPGPLIDCHNTQDPLSDTFLKVIVPEGLVCALSKSQPGRILWSHKFDSPVVSAWRVGKGLLEAVDLFGGTHPPLGPDQEPLPSSPALYIGMHQKQLYIQESVSMQQKVHELADGFRHHLLADERRYPQIPWNPVPVSSTAVGLPSSSQVQKSESSDLQKEDNSQGTLLQTTAMSVLYASEYVNGNGYYLYNKLESSGDSTRDATLCPANSSVENTTEEEIPVVQSPDEIIFTHNQIFVTSLWFWWKEVFLISVTTAVLVNILLRRRLDHTISFHTNELDLVKKTLQSYSSQDSGLSDVSMPLQRSSESFESRFLTDFIPVHCLGKGGFGVVFEAKNKIDDCHYAIKRIPLPNSEDSREKVMREVKALAKLDHQNIVRYFNAWLECPPPGWQETQDQLWLSNRDCFSSNGEACTVDLTGQVTPDSEKSFGHVINRNRLKLQPKSLWQPSPDWLSQGSSLPSKPEPPEDDNDSFIVFQTHSKENSETVSENNNDMKEKDVEDSRKLDSAIPMASDTSRDTNTDVTDVTKSESPTRPNRLDLKKKSERSADSLRMYLFIQMQLCKKKSLKDWLKDNIYNRSKPDVIVIFDQIVQAVEYVHMQGLIHRDLKPSNIFFSPDGQVKVGDFGLVTAMDIGESSMDIWVSVEADMDAWAGDKHTARVGTQLYMSPEQVSGNPYSYKVDIYSLGVILFELLVPFNTQMERIHTLTNLRANKYPNDFHSKFPQEYELLKLMLSPHPDERPTTYGIRARPPLERISPSASASGSLAEWHFELPKRRASSKSSNSSSLDS